MQHVLPFFLVFLVHSASSRIRRWAETLQREKPHRCRVEVTIGRGTKFTYTGYIVRPLDLRATHSKQRHAIVTRVNGPNRPLNSPRGVSFLCFPPLPSRNLPDYHPYRCDPHATVRALQDLYSVDPSTRTPLLRQGWPSALAESYRRRHDRSVHGPLVP